MTHYIPENNVYTYFRHDDSSTVMIILNNNKESTKLSTKRFAENIQKHARAKDILTDTIIDISSEIELGPKSVLILELQ